MLGPQYEELYIELYPFLSWHIHSGSTGYASLSADTFESAFGLMHSAIQRICLEATEICAHEMKIDRLDNLNMSLKSKMDELRHSTSRILHERQDKLNRPEIAGASGP